MTRAEKVAEAQRLRGEGLSVREVAERMGVKYTTAHTWLLDPDLSKQRARRAGYAGTCKNCGAATDGSKGASAAPAECNDCRQARRTAEAKAHDLASAKDFAARFGRPPCATDWDSTHARLLGHHDRAARFEAEDWPWVSDIQSRWGSWNTFIEAAGFEPHPVGRPKDWHMSEAA